MTILKLYCRMYNNKIPYQTCIVAAGAIAAVRSVGEGALLTAFLIALLKTEQVLYPCEQTRQQQSGITHWSKQKLTALAPQSHSSPTSTNPFPHSVASNSCQKKWTSLKDKRNMSFRTKVACRKGRCNDLLTLVGLLNRHEPPPFNRNSL